MVVALVDDGNSDIGAREFLCNRKAAETRPDNDHMMRAHGGITSTVWLRTLISRLDSWPVA